MLWTVRLTYGVGQAFKDLVASMISVFSIVYFENCLKIDSASVGMILFCGQIMNAISTPLIGYLSDRAVFKAKLHEDDKRSISRKWLNWDCQFGLGRRKSWHLYGNIMMIIALPCLFGQSQQAAEWPLWAKLIVNVGLIIVIQIGWAAVQIAHLTMLNVLTSDQNERVRLISLRYFFSSIGDMSTFLLSYLMFQRDALTEGANVVAYNSTDGNWTSQVISNKITTADMPLIRNINLYMTGYGMLCVVLFQCFVPETGPEEDTRKNEKITEVNATANLVGSVPHLMKSLDELHSMTSRLNIANVDQNTNQSAVAALPWYGWFAQARFWLSCAIFTTIRLSITISLIYLSPFLLHSLKLNKASIALLPLAIHCSCLLITLCQHHLSKLLGKLGNTLIGVFSMLTFCSTAYLYQPGHTSPIVIYAAGVMLGIGLAFNNVGPIIVISDLIGTDQMKTAAFVHGFASLMDKVSTGLMVQFIQLSVPTLTYKHIQVFLVGGLVSIGGSLSVLNYYCQCRKQRRNNVTSDANHNSVITVDVSKNKERQI